MNGIKHCCVALAILIPGWSWAHADLELSVPAVNSIVSTMPAEIVLHFSAATRLTALSVEKEGGKVKQDIKVPTETLAVQRVAAPKLPAGVYLLHWRGLSDDSHVVKGAIRFTVTGP